MRTQIQTLDEAGIKFLRDWEKCRLKAYRSSPGEPWTIGWGNTFYEDGRRVKPGDEITQERADSLNLNVLAMFEAGVNRLLKVNTTQGQFNACVSFAYNVGLDEDADSRAEGFGDSTLLKIINQNPFDKRVEGEWVKWLSRDRTFMRGLLRRRFAEIEMYNS